ncbi:hypothetical protein N7451_012258 [Penicillium sp. IBT 35674x]|nr:hypothetical protein N7451_012258 [Penicillium sp. IBT 35674x]
MPLTSVSVPLTILTRFMQWSSAVIVMGITSAIRRFESLIRLQSTMSVAFFLPAFVWLTAFIFAAQDYNWKNCAAKAPVGASCALKKANESFMFLAFLFTVLAIFLELFNFWSYRKEIYVNEGRKHNAQHARDGPIDTVA